MMLFSFLTLMQTFRMLRPHRTHQTIGQAIEFARQIGNQPTYIIHMSHDIAPHAQESLRMPQGIHLAYDGLAVEW